MTTYNKDSIVSLQGLEKVTHMANIYVGDRSSPRALFQMCKEAIDNSLDEAAVVKNGTKINIVFFYNKKFFPISI